MIVPRAAIGFLAVAALAGCGEAPADTAADTAGAAQRADAAQNAAFDEPVTVQSGTADVGGALCGAGEEAVFSCKLANGKHVSVCGAQGAKLAQYRYGISGKTPELIWPARAADGKLQWASTPYSGGGEAQISFARGDTRYVVYSRVIRTNFAAGEPNNPAIEDGVLVLKGSKQLADLKCDDADGKPVDYDLAEKYAEKADDLFFYGE